MNLDRNVNSDGKGKYALVRLRSVEPGSEAETLLNRLSDLGCVDWGRVGEPDEFFVVKLRDRFSEAALRAYAEAVKKEADNTPIEERQKRLSQFALQVLLLNQRAGILSDYCHDPD